MSAIAFIDVLDGDHPRQSFPVAEGGAALRIGRGLGCEICLDDPHLAAEHALLVVGPEPVAQLTLLPSLNGALQERRRHQAGERLDWQSDGVLQLGHTRLRLRHAAAPLAPERALLHAPRSLGLLLLGLAALLLVALETWLAQEPGAIWLAYGGPVLGVAGVLVVWSGLWALLTQLFQRRFPFFTHLRRVLVYLIAVQLLGALLPALGFIASVPALLLPAKLLLPLASVGLVYWHARDVWPKPASRFVLKMFLAGGLLMWLAMGWTRQEALQHRWREPYLSTLLPPGLRAAPLRSVDALLQDAAALRAPLAEKAKVDAEGNEIDDADD
jgi:Inner membrane component of T3SS, cytoplasmic domain